jgi:flagellar hook-associated protein 2
MGTVGLSFGSPTSGAGFDVSSTVSSIVANLQNVETPWKNQLATLQTQDAAISSLGTLMSALSNDITSLTDATGILSEKTGSSSDTDVLTLTAADGSAVAGTHTVEVQNLATTSSGYLAEVSSSSATLSGSVTLQVGNGTAQTITLTSSDNTLAGLAAAINSSSVGVSASVLTDSSGSRLSLVSGTSGADGNITVSANSITGTNQLLAYSGTAGSTGVASSGTLTGINPSDTLSGSISIQTGTGTAINVAVNSSTNTLAGLAGAINSADSAVTASVITNSDGTSSLQILSNTTGTAGTLTITSNIVDTAASNLGYVNTVSGANANLIVDGISLSSASNTVANLIPGVTFQLLAPSATASDGSLTPVQVIIANYNTGVESSVNSMVSDYNALISALNTQEGDNSSGTPEPLFGSPTLSLLQQQLLGALNTTNPTGSLTSISTTADTTLSGSLTIAVGNGTAQTITLTSSDNTIAGLASAINAASIGVTASVVTVAGTSTLTLASGTAGSGGALTVSSAIQATSPTPLSYSGTEGSSGVASTGTLTSIATGDSLTGSISIAVGGGTAQTISLTSSNNTLAGLASTINAANLGVTAAVTTSNGQSSLALTSATTGAAGDLSVTSSLFDTTNTTSTTLTYANSSDVGNLTALGISVNNDGSITLDTNSLDSVLNADYSGVQAFFQNANSWGLNFSNILTDIGTTAGTGILALASSSNSNIESTLNADITRENSLISAQQSSLTLELNQANQILQELPSQLDGVNELYSAITGYNENVGG